MLKRNWDITRLETQNAELARLLDEVRESLGDDTEVLEHPNPMLPVEIDSALADPTLAPKEMMERKNRYEERRAGAEIEGDFMRATYYAIMGLRAER